MNSSWSHLNSLRQIFCDSDEEDYELRDQVGELDTMRPMPVKVTYQTPLKAPNNTITVPQQLDTPMTIQMATSKVKEIRTYQQPPRIELTLASQPNSIETQITETFEYVKTMGSIDKTHLSGVQKKVAAVKKLAMQLVEGYFNNLNRELDRIVNNQSLCTFKDNLLLELIQMKRTLAESPSDIPTSTRLWSIKTLIKQKEQEAPKQVLAKLDLNQLSNLTELLPRLIHFEYKEELSILPLTNRPKLLLKSFSEIRHQEDVFIYHRGALYTINVNSSTTLSKIDLKPTDILLPDLCTLIHVPQSKELVMVGNTMLLNASHFEPTARVLRFSLHSNQLREGTSMPALLFDSQVIYHETCLYVWGGRSRIDNQTLFSKRGYKYSIVNDEWCPLPSMQYPRIHGSICQSGSRIFLIGGMMNKLVANTSIEIYNTTIEEFETPLLLSNGMTYQPSIKGWAYQISQREILLFGGCTQNRQSSQIQLLDTVSRSIQLSGSTTNYIERSPQITSPVVLQQRPLALAFQNNYLESYEINPSGAKLIHRFNIL